MGDETLIYNGIIETFKSRKCEYVVAYWTDDGSYEDAMDHEQMKAAELTGDYIRNELII